MFYFFYNNLVNRVKFYRDMECLIIDAEYIECLYKTMEIYRRHRKISPREILYNFEPTDIYVAWKMLGTPAALRDSRGDTTPISWAREDREWEHAASSHSRKHSTWTKSSSAQPTERFVPATKSMRHRWYLLAMRSLNAMNFFPF